MIAPDSMEVDEILSACLVIDRRRPGTNEFGEEIPEIDVDVMAIEPSLVDCHYEVRAESRFLIVGQGARLWRWFHDVNRGRFVAAILNMLKLDIEVCGRGKQREIEGTVAKEIFPIAPMTLFFVVTKDVENLLVGSRSAGR